MSYFSLTVPGKPLGKGRPRFAKGRVFTDAATAQAEDDVLSCWMAAGSPRVDGPLSLGLGLYVERPKGHYKRDGSLSAEGLRHPYPENQKPDTDNALKLVMDALNGRAWRDDVQVVAVSIARRWAKAGESARTVVHVGELKASEAAA